MTESVYSSDLYDSGSLDVIGRESARSIGLQGAIIAKQEDAIRRPSKPLCLRNQGRTTRERDCLHPTHVCKYRWHAQLVGGARPTNIG